MPAGTGQLLNSAWDLLPVEVGAALTRRLADPELPVSAANLGSRRRQFTVAEGLWWTELFGPHVAGLVAVAIGPETGPERKNAGTAFAGPERLYQSAKALKFRVFTLGSMAAWLSPPSVRPTLPHPLVKKESKWPSRRQRGCRRKR